MLKTTLIGGLKTKNLYKSDKNIQVENQDKKKPIKKSYGSP